MAARGIGDAVWHVPILRRLAAITPERQITFLTRPTTHAADLMRNDPAVSEVAYVPFQGKRHKFREVAALTRAFRTLAPRAVWVLDQTAQPSFAAWLAGTPKRYGTGEGRLLQIAMLSAGPRLKRGKDHQIDKLHAFMDAWGAPVVEGPLLIVDAAERQAVASLFGALPRPWIAFGMTASWAPKIWPADRFAVVADQLARGGTAFFIGGPGDEAITRTAAEAMSQCQGVAVSQFTVARLMALLEGVDLYVGNDSGPMNVAAGVGAKTLGLFGPTPKLSYAANLDCLMSPDQNIASISTTDVIDRASTLLG